MAAVKRRFVATAASASTNGRRIAQQARQAFEDRVRTLRCGKRENELLNYWVLAGFPGQDPSEATRPGEGQAKFPLHPNFSRCWPRLKKGPRAEKPRDVPSFFHSRPHGGGIHGRGSFHNKGQTRHGGKGKLSMGQFPRSWDPCGTTGSGKKNARGRIHRGRAHSFALPATWRHHPRARDF